MSAGRSITFRKVGDDVVVEVDGNASMFDAARFELETGDSIRIADDLENTVLRSLRPSDAALDQGAAVTRQNDALPDWLGEPPYDTGVVVNGEPYTWYAIYGTELHLLPSAFASSSVCVGSLNAWQSGSMAGADISIECWWRRSVSFISYREFDSGNPPWLSIDYACLDPIDQVLALPGLLEWESDKICGECSDQGWVITVEVADPVPIETIGEIMAAFWQPCPAHASTWQVDMAGRCWIWDGSTWAPRDGLRPAR